MKKHEDLLESGWALLEDGDLAGARKVADRLRDASATRGDGLLLHAAIQREEGNAAKAIELLVEAAKLDAEWATPLMWHAEILATEVGDTDEALKLVTKALEVADDDEVFLDALALKAGLEVNAGDIKAARATLEDAPPPEEIDFAPPLALELAHLMLAVGDIGTARGYFEALIEADPSLSDAWHGLGLAADQVADTATRDRAWLEALRLDREEDDDAGHDVLTDDELVAMTREVIAAQPEAIRAFFSVAKVEAASHASDDEVKSGVDPRAVLRLVGEGKTLDAVRVYRKALERETDDADEQREELSDALQAEAEVFFGIVAADA